nr:LamG-like jellyroll fold domain-containing protein [Pleionea sp. CnH1-48]
MNKWLINFRLNRISREGINHSLEPRVMAVLLILIEKKGELVLREEIIEKVWQDRIVSNSSLNRNIALLRKILDVDSSGESCIKTIPKRGYVLEAQVELMSESDVIEPLPKSARDAFENKEDDIKEGDIKEDLLNTEQPSGKKVGFFVLGGALISAIGGLAFNEYQYDTHEDQDPSFKIKQDYVVNQNVTLAPRDKHRAFCLDGVDDYIEVDNHPIAEIGVHDFSISAWIKTDAKGTAVIVDKRNERIEGNVRGFNVHIKDGVLGMQLADGKGQWRCLPEPELSSCTNFYSKSFVADNQWHHVAITVDRDDKQGLKFYVDGTLVKVFDPTTRAGSLTTEQQLRIGSRSSSASALFPGVIGEVKIFNYVRSAEALLGDFVKGVARSCRL